jgi:hypothetical protein
MSLDGESISSVVNIHESFFVQLTKRVITTLIYLILEVCFVLFRPASQQELLTMRQTRASVAREQHPLLIILLASM